MKFQVAPMLDWTDKHCRYFYRIISKETILWTEMITTKAILFGDKKRLLEFDDSSNKTILQLGGSDVIEMQECAKIAKDFGYQEININVGCPSDRVQSGSFGACLMQTPGIVANCVEAMKNQGVKVSIKHRIGVDDMEDYQQLFDFVKINNEAGCNDFIIHARKAWLKGLSPKENRDIPPLNYNWVYQIKQDFPTLNIIINGGIKTIEECKHHLQKVDGVMLGRLAYHNPYLLSAVDSEIYGKKTSVLSRKQILQKYIFYIKKQNELGVPIRSMTRHILGLYYAQPFAKKFKQKLSGKVVVLQDLLDFMES